MPRAICVLLLALSAAASAQTFTTLVNFDNTHGSTPIHAVLIQGLDGSLYGTTNRGGDFVDCPQGCGTVFQLNKPPRMESHQLLPPEGINPAAGLMMTTDGNFFGTADQGAAFGKGTVFEIIDGQELLLYGFCAQANCTDGESPQAPLIQASDGNLYGTTENGGTNTDGCGEFSTGCGTVYRISTTGTHTVLYSFCPRLKCMDGANPLAGLVQADDGNLYGTTFNGGARERGTIFRVTPAGNLTTLYSFCALAMCADGYNPLGTLWQATDGNLYGTTFTGGKNRDGQDGTVFKITKAGVLSILYNFCSLSSCTDGRAPEGGVVQGTDGNFYGTTSGGSGPVLPATVFQMTPAGILRTLHTFGSGDFPSSGLLQATDGAFYGTTSAGGNLSCNAPYGCGTVFRLDMGLPPFVAFVERAGKIGRTVVILGQSFTGQRTSHSARSPQPSPWSPTHH